MLTSLKKKISIWHKGIKLVMFYLPKLTFKKTNPKKTIVVCFDGVFSHGGFVDRLKGIISFYEVAQQLGYDFKIRFEHPFLLSRFFESHLVPWEIKKLRYNPFDTKIIYLMDTFNVNPLQVIKNSNAQTFIIYANVDYLAVLNPEHTDEMFATLWRNHFKALFRNSEFLEKALSQLPQEKHVVFHSRFTSLMGDFKDTTSLVLNEDEQKVLMDSLLKKINQKKLAHSDSKIYVLSDSVIFLNYVKANSDLLILSGLPKHLDVSSNQSEIEAHLKTLTDFIFIANSESVYLLKEGYMYNSGFSRYAAKLGNVPFQVIS